MPFRTVRFLHVHSILNTQKTGNNTIKAIIASENDKALWDNYVIEHKDASPYHLYAWKQAVEAAYGHKGYYIIAISDNENNSNSEVDNF